MSPQSTTSLGLCTASLSPGQMQTERGRGSECAPAHRVGTARTVSGLGLQSASQPRLSYAEMAEDYPRYPDIHDLDLTLLNPRMIVVRRAVPRDGARE